MAVEAGGVEGGWVSVGGGRRSSGEDAGRRPSKAHSLPHACLAADEDDLRLATCFSEQDRAGQFQVLFAHREAKGSMSPTYDSEII